MKVCMKIFNLKRKVVSWLVDLNPTEYKVAVDDGAKQLYELSVKNTRGLYQCTICTPNREVVYSTRDFKKVTQFFGDGWCATQLYSMIGDS